MAAAGPVAKLPCLEQQPHVLSGLSHALSRCVTTETVGSPVSKAIRLLFPGSVHMSIELPVLPKVLLSTQNLLVEGQCALMFYSLSNTLSGHVYTSRCAASATSSQTRSKADVGLLDVEYVSQQLKAHHQVSLPIVLDGEQHVLQAARDNQEQIIPSVLDAYMKLADTAPIMGAVTLGLTKPLCDRELANLCMLMAAMSKHLAHDWKTFFDIADPRHTIAHDKCPSGAKKSTRAPTTDRGGDNTALDGAIPAGAAMEVSSDEYEYASESEDDDTSSTQSDAAFDGTTVMGDVTSPMSGSNARDSRASGSMSVQQRHSGTKRDGCRDDGLRSVRRRHDDSDDGGDDWHSSGGPANSGAGSHGSTAFGGGGATTSRDVRSSGQRPCNSGTRQHGTGKGGGKGPTGSYSMSAVGFLLQLQDAELDRDFCSFYSQQFLLNDRMLSAMSLLIVLTLSLVGGAPALSDVNIWQALDLGMVLLSGVVSFVNVSWYLRYREALMLVRWTSTILINTALMLPVLTSSNTASMAGSLATVGASCLLFASISPLRFSTLVPLLVVQVLATASSLPKLCSARIGSQTLASQCMLRAMAAFMGMVAIPACTLSYVTEACTLRAFRHYRMLETARISTRSLA